MVQLSSPPSDAFSRPLSYQNKHLNEYLCKQHFKSTSVNEIKTYSNYVLDFQQVIQDHAAELDLLLSVRDPAFNLLQVSHRRALFEKY